MEHYLYDCDLYKEERQTLEQTMQDILNREGMLGGAIDLRLMAGSIVTMSKEARCEVIGALIQFIKSSKRFYYLLLPPYFNSCSPCFPLYMLHVGTYIIYFLIMIYLISCLYLCINEPLQKLRARLGSCKIGLSPPVTLCY